MPRFDTYPAGLDTVLQRTQGTPQFYEELYKYFSTTQIRSEEQYKDFLDAVDSSKQAWNGSKLTESQRNLIFNVQVGPRLENAVKRYKTAHPNESPIVIKNLQDYSYLIHRLISKTHSKDSENKIN